MNENDRVTGVIVIAHGSRRPEANQDLFKLVERLKERGQARVFPAFLELTDPTITRAGAQCVASGATQVVLAPYFLSAGEHVVRDLEAIRIELENQHAGVRFVLAEPLGPHDLLDEILRERIAEVLTRNQA